MAENPILIDEEEDKLNSPAFSKTPVSERATQPPVLMRTRSFKTGNENIPDYVYGNVLEQVILSLMCMYLVVNFK